MGTVFNEKQVRTYFHSLNTELGYSNHGECSFLCLVHDDETSSAYFNLDKGCWFCHACNLGGDLYEMEKLLCPNEPFPVIKETVDMICNGGVRLNTNFKLPAKKELQDTQPRPWTEDVTYYYTMFDEEIGKIKAKYAITRAHYDDTPSEKTFRVWYMSEGKRIWKRPDFPLVPYHLPEVQSAQIVFIVEGEKCVDSMMKVLPAKFAATCNPFGAGKWEDGMSQHLKGKKVVILPDNDEPGLKHAHAVGTSVLKFADFVRIGHVPLDEVGSDIADYIDALIGIQDGECTTEQRNMVLSKLVKLMKDSKPFEVAPVIEVVEAENEDEGLIPAMPTSAMYGVLKDKAEELLAPLGWAYPATLAVAASLDIQQLTNIRPTLYVALLGPVHAGKSSTIERAIKNFPNLNPSLVSDKTPGSDRGLFTIFGKDEFKEKTVLLNLDEISLMMKKVNIQLSGLPDTLCKLFYKDTDGGGDKKGEHGVNIKLNILGGLKCKGPDDFLNTFGVNTQDGLADRFIYGMAGTDKFDVKTWKDWKPSIVGPPTTGCYFSDDALRLAWNWIDAGEDRGRLGELAQRIALIASSVNNDVEVTTDSMKAALTFMEWQEKIRVAYQPSEAITMEGKIGELIINSLKRGMFVKWGRFAQNKNLYKKFGARMVAQVRDSLNKEGLLKYDPATGLVTRL